jgi:hypothetical protein
MIINHSLTIMPQHSFVSVLLTARRQPQQRSLGARSLSAGINALPTYSAKSLPLSVIARRYFLPTVYCHTFMASVLASGRHELCASISRSHGSACGPSMQVGSSSLNRVPTAIPPRTTRATITAQRCHNFSSLGSHRSTSKL